MNNPSSLLQGELLRVCIEAQAKLGNNNEAAVWVLNALMWATTEYAVRTTSGGVENAQERFDELSMSVSKVVQEYLAKYTGGAIIIELRKPGELGEGRRMG